jgi:MoxR-like ATPase
MTNLDRESKLCEKIVDTISTTFVGKRTIIRKMVAGALANGHILFEDYPGLGKTLLVKAFAKSIGVDFNRVQFTPDVLPSDILGTKIYDQKNANFKLSKGPIFTNILLADEINRSPPKTQSALLEAMEERQVTIEGETIKLDTPFFVLATQNPIEQEGTYPLPEAQLDRFLLKMSTGYPENEQLEAEILTRRISWQADDPTANIKPIITGPQFRDLQKMVETKVFIHKELLVYIAKVVRGLRQHPKVQVGPSPRGSLALLKASRSMALLNGRDYVSPDDVKTFVFDCLSHRTLLAVEHVLDGMTAPDVVREVMQSVPVPTRFLEAQARAR